METDLWYSVENGGDGSAYPEFMESKELCQIHQHFQIEGWGEECIGHIKIKSDTSIELMGIITIQEAKKEIEDELSEDYMVKYKNQGEYPEDFIRLEGKLKAINDLADGKGFDSGNYEKVW